MAVRSESLGNVRWRVRIQVEAVVRDICLRQFCPFHGVGGMRWLRASCAIRARGHAPWKLGCPVAWYGWGA